DQIGPASLGELSGASPGVGTAVRARRATAAAYAAGFGTLLLAITLGPYRRGDLWAWWAILAGVVVESVLSMLRVPFLGIRDGVGDLGLQVPARLVHRLEEQREVLDGAFDACERRLGPELVFHASSRKLHVEE